MGWIQTLAIFGMAALLLHAATRVLIPTFSDASGSEPVLSWFLVGGLGVFVPLVIAGYMLLRLESTSREHSWWETRLRFRRMNRVDWLWAVGAIAAIGALSATTHAAMSTLEVGVGLHPHFMAFEPLSAGRYWILVAWIPFWILNIMGEEFLWRGVILPRQEAALGRGAWIANASGWLLFHLAFGWQLMVVLLPIMIILPYAVQRRQNSWVGVVIHAGVNGPGFIAVALGLV
jgi:membrane protease YdiL (CAAX protease family)